MRGWASRRAIMSEPAAEIAHQFVDAGQQRDGHVWHVDLPLHGSPALRSALSWLYRVSAAEPGDLRRSCGAYAHRGLDQYGHPARQQLCVAVAVHLAEQGDRFRVALLLCAAALLGVLFLAVKAYEYNHKIQEGFFPGQSFHFSGPHSRGVEMFFVLYFTMTGLHALHVAVGVAVLTGYGIAVLLAQRPARLATGSISPASTGTSSISSGFSFPLFYLVGRAP